MAHTRKPHLAIRVDASAQIGIGHLFRCLRLAEHLRSHFETITFIAHNPSDFYHATAQEHGFQLQAIPTQDDLGFLESGNYDYIIKDHYTLDQKWEEQARAKTSKFIVMDDRADQHHTCDIYINQNPVEITPAHLPDDCLILDGLRYAILPDALLGYKNNPKGKDILISLGGSDPTNELQKCLTAFHDMDDFHLHFITGKENPNAAEIEKICANTPHYTYHHFIDNIHELAAQAYACITAGGTLLRELVYMQTPCFLITNHDVQIPIAEYFSAQNAVFYAGHYTTITTADIKSSFTAFISDKNRFETYRKNMKDLIDGNGLSRITNAITADKITMMPATKDHCKMIYDWRNHPTTRQYSGDTNEITFENHSKWFDTKLQDPNSLILIAQVDKTEIGVIRFDHCENGLIVSLYLSPDQHGHGYGAPILLAGIQTLKEKGLTPITLIAKIFDINKASQNAFKKAGFTQITPESWEKDLS